jgi:hypothetical protein
MVFLTRWFGVTESDADRDSAREKADIEAIVEKSLLMQANAAAKQQRSLCRGTHAKGVCTRAQFAVFDVTLGHEPALATRLAKGIFAKPGAVCKCGREPEFGFQAGRKVVVYFSRPRSGVCRCPRREAESTGFLDAKRNDVAHQ